MRNANGSSSLVIQRYIEQLLRDHQEPVNHHLISLTLPPKKKKGGNNAKQGHTHYVSSWLGEEFGASEWNFSRDDDGIFYEGECRVFTMARKPK